MREVQRNFSEVYIEEKFLRYDKADEALFL